MTFADMAEQVIEEWGWPVFPVSQDKVPCIKGGYKAASKDPQIITEWGRQFPGANVAIPTGAASGVFVIDLDDPLAESSLAQYGQLPKTLTATSGRGEHLYFQHTGSKVFCRAGQLAERVDVRGDGGSVTVPPSLHRSGRRYQWVDAGVPIKLPPPWLLRQVGERREQSPYPNERKAPNLDKLLRELRGARPGTRNHALNRASYLAGMICKAGGLLNRDAMHMLISEGLALGLSKPEVMATVRSGLRAGMR